MGKLSKFRQLTGAEKRFFLYAVIVLGSFRLALLLVPLHRLLRRPPHRPEQRKQQSQLTVEQVTRLIKAAARLVPGTTCLSNSLAGQHLFATQGYQTKMHIGVNKDRNRTFAAHAWLTLGSSIVIGSLPDLDTYQELPNVDTALFNR